MKPALISLIAVLVLGLGVLMRNHWAYEQEVATLRASVAELAQQREEPRPSGPPFAVVPSMTAVPDVRAQLAAPANEEREERNDDHAAPSTEAQLDHLERDVFAARPVDGALTQLARERLAPTLGEGSSLRALECRGELCRIEVEHVDPDRAERFLASALRHGPSSVWNGASLTAVVSPDGDKPVTVSWLAREGSALPAL